MSPTAIDQAADVDHHSENVVTTKIDQAADVDHHGENVVTTKIDPKSTAHHSELDAALHKTLDHFRTSLMTRLYDLVPSLYVYHQNMKPSIDAQSHFNDHQWHSKYDDDLEERRIHPFVDMWETKSDYLADIEIPGIKNKESITVQWTSPRSIMIEAMVSRPRVEGWDTKANGSKVEAGDKGDEQQRNWISSERRIGKFERILTFAADVDMEAVSARLEAGLLRIKVPKRSSRFEGWKVQVL